MPYVRCPCCDVLTYCVRGERCPSCDTELLPPAPRLPGRPRSVRRVDELLALAVRQLGMEASVVGEVTEGTEVVRHVRDETEGLGFVPGMRAPLAETFCEQLLERRIGNAVPDTHREPSLAHLPATRELGIRAYIGVPFTLDDARLYVVCCLSRERQPRLGEREVAFLRGIAESIRQHLQG